MNASHTHPDEILVVDDTPANLKLLQDILGGAGYQVRLANGGVLALHNAKIQPPALVLLDIRMPGMDGYEVCQRLKEDEKTRSVPIIFLSILEDEHEKAKAFRVGAVDYITKPIRAAEVLARVSTHLALRHAQLDLEARNAELEVARETLEEKVKERSAELEQANRQLQQQIDVHLNTFEALRESEAKYRSLIRKVQTAIVLHDGEGRILAGNPMAQELLGLSEDQMLGKVLIDPGWHFLREDGAVMPVAEYPVSLVLATRQPLRDYVAGICRPDRDDVTWALVSAEPEYDEAGAIEQVIVSFIDITERKRTENALHRLNRELQAISNCNQALMRAVDEPALLNDICRIICDGAGYRLAWVGYAENDDARTIRPVAWAGAEDGYLAAANITWADTERGRGPCGTAIRSGESACIQDFATDPHAAPWRENALQRGYRSSIALPLKDESKTTFGVLNIYSTEPNAFTPDETRLLEELAGDLAFGVITLRTRAERKQAEEALRDSERRLAEAQRIAHIGYWERDFETSCITLSAEACRIFGLPPQGFPLNLEQWHQRWLELIHPEDQPRTARAAADALKDGPPYNVEYRIIRPDGEVRFIHSEADVKRDEASRPRSMLGMMQDITEYKWAQEALRESEERYRLVFENSPVSIWEEDFSGVKALFDDLKKEGVTDIETYFAQHSETVRQCADLLKIIDVNQATLALHGAATKEELLAGLVQTFTPESFETFRHELICLWNGEMRMIRDAVVQTLAGEPRHVTVYFSVCPGYEETLAKVLVSLIDITERMRVEAALRASEWRYREIFDNVLDGIYLLEVTDDGRFRTIEVNPALERLTGVPRSFSVGKTQEEIVPPEVAEIVNAKYRHCVEAGRPIEEEVRLDLPAGQRYFQSTLIPARDETGKIYRLVGISRDVTEQKQAEDEVRRLNQELEQRVRDRTAQLEAANKELEAFAYSVSHDLRAPLRHIDGYLELLQQRMASTLDERSRHYMYTISDSARRMGQLIDDLLSFSRMGRHEMSKTPIDLGGLVQEVIRELAPETQDRAVHWRIADLPTVSGDRAMLRLVLTNLIANALKFSRGRLQADIEIGRQADQKESIIFVRDNGVGFDMAYVDKLFGVFQRLHHAEDFEGTGIGLANVRRIITRHGGRVWAEGEADRGATFYFSLPQSIQEN